MTLIGARSPHSPSLVCLPAFARLHCVADAYTCIEYTLLHPLVAALTSSRLQSLEHCRRAQVVYLYGNRLTTIECLGSLVNLTHLFLQSNNITKLQGLEALSNLQKLFLSHNRIRRVEGLASCSSLLELQISDQRMGPDETLTFDQIGRAHV